MGFENYYTKYTPDLNVGISKLILGETTINSPSIISGDNLIKNLYGDSFFYDRSISRDQYYPKEYDKSLFKNIPSLKFDTSDYSLSGISCVLNDEYKIAILEELNNRFGPNRNNEWRVKGIYRTEINNKYAIIQINLWEFNSISETNNNYGEMISEATKELVLEMNITKLKSTKSQIEHQIKLNSKLKEVEKDKEIATMKIKSSVKNAFNLD